MIDDMVVKLGVEQEDDDAQQKWCNAEFDKSEDESKDTKRLIEGLETTRSRSGATRSSTRARTSRRTRSASSRAWRRRAAEVVQRGVRQERGRVEGHEAPHRGPGGGGDHDRHERARGAEEVDQGPRPGRDGRDGAAQ